jgi:hypothetical protein
VASTKEIRSKLFIYRYYHNTSRNLLSHSTFITTSHEKEEEEKEEGIG